MSQLFARRFASLLFFALLTLALSSAGASPGLAATFTVNSRTDSGDALYGDGACDTGSYILVGGLFQKQCTLRAAIMESCILRQLDSVTSERASKSLALIARLASSRSPGWSVIHAG